jgi:hypothetical protein
MSRWSWGLLLLLLAADLARTQPTVCKMAELERTVEVVYADPGQPVPCEVLYAKADAGTIEILWRANHEAGYCEERAAAFVARLEQLGWDCRAPAVLEADAGA